MEKFHVRENIYDEFMRIDMSISASGLRYKRIVQYSLTMLFIFPIGVPLALFLLLFSRRHAIQSRRTRLGGSDLATLSYFFRIYSKKFWWMAPTDLGALWDVWVVGWRWIAGVASGNATSDNVTLTIEIPNPSNSA